MLIKYRKSEIIIVVLISTLLSAGVIVFDLGEEVTFELIFLVIGSIILGKINVRLTCLAYVASSVYIIDLLITLLGIKGSEFNLPYEKLILLVGIMHIIEGFMAYFYGAIDNVCVLNYKDKQIIGGYRAYRKWYIPLFLFEINGIYLPLICIMAYCDETYTMMPSRKSHINGTSVLIYGVVVACIGFLTIIGILATSIAMLIMPIAHEVLFMIDEHLEKEPYIYDFPKKGVRVIEVSGNQDSVNKIQRGDIILKVNGKQIVDEDSYYKEIDSVRMVMTLKDLDGNKKILHFDKVDYDKLEVIILPKE